LLDRPSDSHLQIPAEMMESVTGSKATKKWESSAREPMAEYHE
jgi:hypothetical protein